MQPPSRVDPHVGETVATSLCVRVENLDLESNEPVRVTRCDSFSSRLRGLMFRSALAVDQGVLLVGDQDSRLDAAIHMLFVPFDLAVFWINSDMVVVDKVLARSWRAAYVPRRPAHYVLELHPERYGYFDVGNKVRIINA